MSEDEMKAAPGDPPVAGDLPVAAAASTELGLEVLRAVASRVVDAAGEPATRLNVLNNSTYGMGRLVGGGHITYDDALSELLAATASWQLSERDHKRVKKAIELALRAGMKRPQTRELTPAKRGAAATEDNSAVGP